MKQREKASAHGRGLGFAAKRAADEHARLLPIFRRLIAAAVFSERALAAELNRRGIRGARGGRWHRGTVRAVLLRLGLITVRRGRVNMRLAHKRAADARASVLAATIRRLRKTGVVSFSAIARELTKRQVPTARGGKWHRSTVSGLLHRLEKLETARRRRGGSSSHRR
jgi:Recombinase